MDELLGKTGTERYSKFSGTITGIAKYSHHANEVLINPGKVDEKTGLPVESKWFPASQVDIAEGSES